jgi:hypothetical protein
MSQHATVTALPTGPRILDQLYQAVATDGLCAGAVTDKASGAEADDVWFANRTTTPDEAAEACKGCPVIAECLEQALRRGETFGIWGGTTPEQRAEILGLEQAVAS